MLNVTVNPKEYMFTMSGHAGFAEQGRDIVCSAASILFYTACETVGMIGEEAFEDKPVFNIDDGKDGVSAYIRCTPKNDYKAVLDTVYQTIYNGYKLLSEGYPNNVRLTVRD